MRVPKGTAEIAVGLIFIGPSVLILFGPVAYWVMAGLIMVAYTIGFWFEDA